MRKVNLRMNELEKYEVIKKLVDTNGNKKRAAVKLRCSIRTINRLINVYKKDKKNGFVHGNRGRAPSTALDLNLRSQIISLYINDYLDCNFTHFCEIIKKDMDVVISSTTLKNWLKEEDIISPKAHRHTKKELKQTLKEKARSTRSVMVQNEIKETIHQLDESNVHPRRPRCKYTGEMIQMDASSYEWIPDEIWHLHLAIDDASGTVVGAYFDTQETLLGYYNVFYQILTDHGIPAMFYTDKRTVFEYKRKNNPFDDEDTFTQFSYACHTLGIDIKTTSVAQAKGRIERLNQTFQSRLPIELKRAHVHNIEEANKFLKSYLKEFNEQFALRLNSTQSVYEKQPSNEKINTTLAILSGRKIDSGHSIKYKNKYYLPCSDKGTKCYFKRKTDCMVIEAFDGGLYVNILDQLYSMEEIPLRDLKSREFDKDYKEARPKTKYIPPMDHPWRLDNYITFFGNQKHRTQSGVNV